MVLQELGAKLTAALRKLQNSTVLDEEVVNGVLQDISRALIEADVNIKLVMSLRNAVKQKVNLEEGGAGLNRRKMIQRAVMEELVNMVDPGAKPYQMKKGKQNVVMFVGLQGSGKTTTIAKFANYYQRKGWKTCMVCADTFRAGAFDQLRQNATKLRVPFYGSYTEADPVRIAEEGVAQFRAEHYEVIIVDTSGRHKQEEALFEEMKEIESAIQPDSTVFVMDATQGQAVFDQAKGFHDAVEVGSVVITKLDGHAKGGGALSAVAATKAPIVFLGMGEHFDDLEPFNAQSFVSRLLGMGDVRGLMEDIKSTMDLQKPELMQKFSKGIFTLRDMYEQFQNVLKLGPLNKVMAKLPGFPQYLMPNDQEGNKRLKKFMYMMDSMTDDELDGKADIEKSSSRIERIARGSGTHPMEVQMLLKCHKQFEQVIKKMGKTSLMKGTDQHMQKQMMRNPQAVMQQLHRAIDPRMLQQMGGAGNLMKMMSEMSKMDAGDLQGMMSQMGGMGGLGALGGQS